MKRGTTLVDGLVLAASGVVLACLLLPAIVAARSEARDLGCVRNLKQIGLGLHNYHAVYASLPMSSIAAGGPGHGTGHDCFTSMLPFLELSPIYNAYNFSLENWNEANATVVGLRLNTFLCPENRGTEPLPAEKIRTIEGNVLPGKSRFGPLHFGANWGGERAGWATDFERDNGTFRGVMLPLPSRGPNGPNGTLKLDQIKDGLSFTLAVGEKRDSFGWAVGGWAGSEFDPGTTPAYDGENATTQRVYTGSFHERPNFLLLDGSVRALPGTLDRKVWYALITRDGGEAINEAELSPRVEN
ncbi:MAG TPA: DUF1559 domain-containing protein [Isosphaeraceae bacterium]|jgi:hypothetical protein|nr:DUF1559 domain-containing protein [Isosphaeraceae bacterium]